MSLEQTIMAEMKDAMKAKDEAALRSLRAIKAEILKSKTEPGASGELSDEAEIKMLQKMVKQRKDSLEIYQQQNREDLVKKEKEELQIIERFLPQQLDEEELRIEIKSIIHETGASSPAEIGKVMGVATKKLAGRADGKTISAIARQLLSQ